MDGYTVGQMHHPLGQWSRLSVILGHLSKPPDRRNEPKQAREREVLDESVGAFVVLTRPNHFLHSEPPQNLGNPGRGCGGKAGTTLPSWHFLDSHEQLAEGQPLWVPVLIPSLVTHLRWLPDWRKTGGTNHHAASWPPWKQEGGKVVAEPNREDNRKSQEEKQDSEPNFYQHHLLQTSENSHEHRQRTLPTTHPGWQPSAKAHCHFTDGNSSQRP